MSKKQTLEYIMTAIDYIEAHLSEELSVNQVCQLSPVSMWQFQRQFRALVGDSIGNYLRARRLTVAVDRLVQTDERILDIAIDLQFGSHEAFSRAFKTHFKISPETCRLNKNDLKVLRKPRLSREHILHFQTDVQRNPDIRQIEGLNLIGLKTTINSHLGSKPDYEEKLPQLWNEFVRLKKEYFPTPTPHKYGVAISESETLFEEELTYLAAMEIPADALVPHSMVTLTIEPKLYACFERVGLPDKSAATIDYVYGIWLPQSGYQRAKGYDLEIFDKRYQLNNPQSVSLFCIPIEKAHKLSNEEI